VNGEGEIRVLVGALDYEGLVAFYRDAVGFPVHEVWDDPDGHGTLFRAGAGIIEVIADGPDHRAERPRGVSVAIETPDVDALHARLRDRAEVTLELGDRPWGHRSFGITDPGGLPLIFFSVIA
jgi:uncharacterized glyoxalase superfamily protein PhnB